MKYARFCGISSLALVLTAVACVRTVAIDGQPCPCPDDGYVCCASDNRCLPAGATCGGEGDAGSLSPDSGLPQDGRIVIDAVTPLDAAPNPHPTGEDVVLFPAWLEFMSGTGNRTLVASWYNGTKESLFVDRSCGANWWQLRNGAWVSKPSPLCPASNPSLTEIPPGGTLRALSAANLAYYGNGVYRLQGTYSLGCSSGSDCASSVQVVGPEVLVSLMAGPAPNDPPVANPGELHAVCSEYVPCPPDQTALETFYDDGVTCSCEMRCTPDHDGCPAGTTCTHVSDGIGSLCQ